MKTEPLTLKFKFKLTSIIDPYKDLCLADVDLTSSSFFFFERPHQSLPFLEFEEVVHVVSVFIERGNVIVDLPWISNVVHRSSNTDATLPPR